MEIQLDKHDNHWLIVLKKITHDLESPVPALTLFIKEV